MTFCRSSSRSSRYLAFFKSFARGRSDIVAYHTFQSNGLISVPVRRYVRNALQMSMLAFVLLVLFLWLGAEYESFRLRQTADTLVLYQQPQVCGVIPRNASSTTRDTAGTAAAAAAAAASNKHTEPTVQVNTTTPETFSQIQPFHNSSNDTTTITTELLFTIETFPSQAQVEAAGGFVGHCGSCGACSNPHDISIYSTTKNTLFAATTTCAKRALIWGRITASNCLEDTVGFTDQCNYCWVENILCDLRKCIFTCLFYGLFDNVDGGAGAVSTGGTALNPCTECDERRCGPEFIACAGANRRRSGIVSDIARDGTTEVCQSVPEGWWDNPMLQYDEWKRNGQK